MTVKQLVEALDAEVVKGNIVDAFERFAAEDCVTWSDAHNKTTSKAHKLEILGWFFQNIARINRIERPAVQVEGNVTLSQFVFDFTNRQGESLVYQEVIRRVWKDGKVAEEQYLLNEVLPSAKKTAVKKSAASPQPQEVSAPAVEPAPAPAEVNRGKTTGKKSTTKKSAK